MRFAALCFLVILSSVSQLTVVATQLTMQSWHLWRLVVVWLWVVLSLSALFAFFLFSCSLVPCALFTLFAHPVSLSFTLFTLFAHPFSLFFTHSLSSISSPTPITPFSHSLHSLSLCSSLTLIITLSLLHALHATVPLSSLHTLHLALVTNCITATPNSSHS